MTTPSTHHLLIQCPETGETRPPTETDVLTMIAGANLGMAIGQLVHVGETSEKIRARVEEVLDSLAPKVRS